MHSPTVSDQVTQANSISPRNVLFNANFNLPDGLGQKDVGIHQSGEILALNAERQIRETLPGASQESINKVKDFINYSVKADPGKANDKFAGHRQRMKSIQAAQKMATEMAEAMSIAEPQGQAISQAEAIPMGIKNANGIVIDLKQPQQVPQANSFKVAAQKQLMQAMAYDNISIDSFFEQKIG